MNKPATYAQAIPTWKWVIQAAGKLPAGEVLVTMRANLGPRGLAEAIHSVYITIPGRGGEVAKTKVYDDGSVVVELGPNNEFLGIELLHLKERKDLPQFSVVLQRRKVGDLLSIAFWTAHSIWHRTQFAFKVVMEDAGRPPKKSSVLRASPGANQWQEQKEDHLAALV